MSDLTHMTNQIPGIITQYLAVAGSADPADADRVAACFTSDGEVIDEGETRRGRAAIRQWWEGPATTYDYTVEVRSQDHHQESKLNPGPQCPHTRRRARKLLITRRGRKPGQG